MRGEPLTGRVGPYWWLVSVVGRPILPELVVREHLGLHVRVVAFDGGPLQLSAEELALGWAMQGEVAVSPSLSPALGVPHDDYDEWYVTADATPWSGPVERFVSHCGFTLADPVLLDSHDPSGPRGRHDHWGPLQERFWSQLERLAPETYIASGDVEVLVTRRCTLVDAARREVARSGRP